MTPEQEKELNALELRIEAIAEGNNILRQLIVQMKKERGITS